MISGRCGYGCGYGCGCACPCLCASECTHAIITGGGGRGAGGDHYRHSMVVSIIMRLVQPPELPFAEEREWEKVRPRQRAGWVAAPIGTGTCIGEMNVHSTGSHSTATQPPTIFRPNICDEHTSSPEATEKQSPRQKNTTTSQYRKHSR